MAIELLITIVAMLSKCCTVDFLCRDVGFSISDDAMLSPVYFRIVNY